MLIDPPIGELLQKVDCRYTLGRGSEQGAPANSSTAARL